jgi:hypothetical protein
MSASMIWAFAGGVIVGIAATIGASIVLFVLFGDKADIADQPGIVEP